MHTHMTRRMSASRPWREVWYHSWVSLKQVDWLKRKHTVDLGCAQRRQQAKCRSNTCSTSHWSEASAKLPPVVPQGCQSPHSTTTGRCVRPHTCLTHSRNALQPHHTTGLRKLLETSHMRQTQPHRVAAPCTTHLKKLLEIFWSVKAEGGAAEVKTVPGRDWLSALPPYMSCTHESRCKCVAGRGCD